MKDIFSNIYRDRKPLSSDLKCENAIRALSAQHLLHLGDLCKFKSKYETDSKKDECWSFYTRAKTVYPFDGRIYGAFGALSQKESDYLNTVYFLTRSLACELPHEPSREYLVTYFEEIRQKYIENKRTIEEKKGGDYNRSNKNLIKEDQRFYKFIIAFFRVQGILYTKIGADEIEKINEVCIKNLKEHINSVEKETNKVNETLKF